METMSISGQRLRTMLRTALGEGLSSALNDPNVFEIMVNPDGSVRLDFAETGRVDTGVVMPAADIERVIRLVASHVRAEVHADNPIVSTELPGREEGRSGERFEGLLPPVVEGPCFSIRKPAYKQLGLQDYVAAGIMSAAQARILTAAVVARKNILVAGGTSSGKTTLTNALLSVVAEQNQRVLIIEDTRELRCVAEDVVALRTRPGVVSMTQLVRSTLRLRPDRIIVGEVRGPEALDMLKAWNTGHPGGLATLHANSARSALYRLEQLIQEAIVNVPKPLIAEAIDLIVFICAADAQTGASRHIAEIVEVKGLDARGEYDLRPLISNGEDPASTHPIQ